MATVGGVTCTFVKVRPAGARPRLRVWESAGVDGYGAQNLGLGSPTMPVRCILFDTQANVATWRANIEALVGTVVSITDDRGITYASVLITESEPAVFTTAKILGTSKDTRGEILLSGRRSL